MCKETLHCGDVLSGDVFLVALIQRRRLLFAKRHGLPFTAEVAREELDAWKGEEIDKGLEEMKSGKLLITPMLSSAGRLAK